MCLSHIQHYASRVILYHLLVMAKECRLLHQTVMDNEKIEEVVQQT